MYQTHLISTGKKDAPSGNRTKQAMINVLGVNSAEFWKPIIYGDTSALFEPINDESVLSKMISKQIKIPLNEPEGYKKLEH
ncbi:hypothetical protein [Cedecea sp. FDAARGOS_727]|uniref:hypothetical protein n=1 Tax=Cedecea sp. FDAARGOS_727 TaxID=2545798 RepID=UPI002738D0BF|nr:hypothetical protein [Cedecea sp. FDAARGOS_727]